MVHAFGGSPKKFWYGRLRDHLLGEAEVAVPQMPGGRAPQIAAWLSCLRTTVQDCATPESNLYLIGHSVGCSAILRLLASESDSTATPLRTLRGVLCVAGWLWVDEPWAEMEPWPEPRV